MAYSIALGFLTDFFKPHPPPPRKSAPGPEGLNRSKSVYLGGGWIFIYSYSARLISFEIQP